MLLISSIICLNFKICFFFKKMLLKHYTANKLLTKKESLL